MDLQEFRLKISGNRPSCKVSSAKEAILSAVRLVFSQKSPTFHVDLQNCTTLIRSCQGSAPSKHKNASHKVSKHLIDFTTGINVVRFFCPFTCKAPARLDHSPLYLSQFSHHCI